MNEGHSRRRPLSLSVRGSSSVVQIGVDGGVDECGDVASLRRTDKVKTILVLEDESMLLKLLGSVLSQDYCVLKATTAEQALSLFIEHSRQVDLLVADLSLAKSSGILVALLLRSVIPGLPIILTSGYPVNSWCERDAADLVRLGPRSVAIIEKPFLSRTLLKAVRELTREPQTELARTA
jgi:DNA-binding response OmpR family regulator